MSYTTNLKALIRSSDKTIKRKIDAIQRELRDLVLTPGAVHTSATLSQLSVQYRNEEYIGDMLMPIVRVSKNSGTYYKYGKGDRLAQHDDAIGPRGKANEVTETRTEATVSMKPRGLENYVDAETIANQDAPLDEMADLTDAINDNLALNKEIRKAAILTTAANFGSNTATLSGTSQWDSSTGGDPVKNLSDATDALWVGNGATMIMGYTGPEAFSALRRHPAILDLFKYNKTGLASPQMIAEYFGWEGLLVGRARKQTSADGQTPTYGRVWGKDFGVVRVAKNPGVRTASFGYDFQMVGDPTTLVWFDPKLGKIGGYSAKVAFSEDLEVVAADTGYLFKSVVA